MMGDAARAADMQLFHLLFDHRAETHGKCAGCSIVVWLVQKLSNTLLYSLRLQ
jgi:hypothetical protein